MNKWAIFSDVDGTLYGFPDKQLSDVNKGKIIEISQKGIPFILNTGNGPLEKIKKLARLTNSKYILCANGAVVYDNDEEKYVHIEYIDHQEAQKVFDVAKRINAHLYYFGVDQYYLYNHDQKILDFFTSFLEYDDFITDGRINEDLYKIEVYGNFEEVKLAYEELLKANINLNIVYFKTHIEITKTNVDKGSGIRWICDNVLNIDVADVMAIGDSYNDIPMFKIAGYSYVMDNADDEVKAFAKYYTSDVRQNGLAEAIDDYLYRSDFELKRAISQQKKKK